MSGSGPIYEYQREVTARLEQAIRERDEALAEVGAAHVQLGMSDIRHRLEASEIRRLLGSLSDALHERDKAQAECAGAYQRGAEAMREAAASLFDAPISTPEREVLLAWAESIRVLPMPKDKP